MISFDEALALVRAAANPLDREIVAIQSAPGRVLAEPVVAQIASPRSDVSAMDGYAVRDADLVNFPAALQLIGESFAGAGWSGSVGERECVRIFTGAPVPPGANRVVIQEEVRRDGDTAIIDRHPGEVRYIRGRGSDFEQGDDLLPAGRVLDKRAIVAAAAADLGEVSVFYRPESPFKHWRRACRTRHCIRAAGCDSRERVPGRGCAGARMGRLDRGEAPPSRRPLRHGARCRTGD